jgi:hypothetical protein
MRRFRTTLGAHALTARSAGYLHAHASASAAAPASASAWAHSKASWHELPPFPQPPPLTRATWHQECGVRQLTAQKSSEDILDRAADKPDHLHACGSQSRLERGGDGAANQDIRAEASQVSDPGGGLGPGQPNLLAPQFAPILDFHQQQAARDVEDGRYTTLPVRNRDPHRSNPMHGSCQIATLGK